ncbi:hypothetical protein EON77_14210 [bacterium]|nr:MAG: hypothetical protein EON77_14210 [bacterium]
MLALLDRQAGHDEQGEGCDRGEGAETSPGAGRAFGRCLTTDDLDPEQVYQHPRDEGRAGLDPHVRHLGPEAEQCTPEPCLFGLRGGVQPAEIELESALDALQ